MKALARLAGALTACALVLGATRANAQVHWDASATAGPALRRAEPGVVAQLASHVALLPLVRAGIAFHGEVEPGSASLWLGGGSARLKLLSPWPAGSTRLYLHVGVGLTFARGEDALGTARSGRLGELPFGLGCQARVWGPWAFVGELGLRPAFAHGGALFPRDDAGLGLALLLGIQYDR